MLSVVQIKVAKGGRKSKEQLHFLSLILPLYYWAWLYKIPFLSTSQRRMRNEVFLQQNVRHHHSYRRWSPTFEELVAWGLAGFRMEPHGADKVQFFLPGEKELIFVALSYYLFLLYPFLIWLPSLLQHTESSTFLYYYVKVKIATVSHQLLCPSAAPIYHARMKPMRWGAAPAPAP